MLSGGLRNREYDRVDKAASTLLPREARGAFNDPQYSSFINSFNPPADDVPHLLTRPSSYFSLSLFADR